jgi:hypothetical protein
LFHNICFDKHDLPGWDHVFTTIIEETANNPAFQLTTMIQTLNEWIRSGGYEHESDVLKKIRQVKKKS